MEIKQAYWFSGMGPTIGIVVGKDTVTGKPKGYIGTVPGFNEDLDTRMVAEHGSPVDPKIMAEIADHLKG